MITKYDTKTGILFFLFCCKPCQYFSNLFLLVSTSKLFVLIGILIVQCIKSDWNLKIMYEFKKYSVSKIVLTFHLSNK